MNNRGMELLEFDKIKAMLKTFTLSEETLARVEALVPMKELEAVRRGILETTETKGLLGLASAVPLHSLKGIGALLDKMEKGMVLRPGELNTLATFLENVIKMKGFMERAQTMAPLVSSYGLSLYSLNSLIEAIRMCIRGEQIEDRATPALFKIRKKKRIVEERLKSKLDHLMRTMGEMDHLQDQGVSLREGRYVLPVKREHYRSLHGEILDRSNSGATLFVEPPEVKKLQQELNLLIIEEEEEKYKILAGLTAEAAQHQREISINREIMVHYDFLFAKAKLSRSMGGNPVQMNWEKRLVIKEGRHPLLGKDCVPLNLTIGEKYRTLVITGPNTGGKTIVLKTVGLLTLMAQAGLHVPVGEGSELALFQEVLVDIGDGQSIEQSLSTFSSHLKNLKEMLEMASEETLVIVDELGSGTDPGEGMGLATAILEAFYELGAITLATSHFSEIKNLGKEHPGFENGCMEFDLATLKPLYRLVIGQSGESNGFYIALRLGLSPDLIAKAHRITYQEEKDYHQILTKLPKAHKENQGEGGSQGERASIASPAPISEKKGQHLSGKTSATPKRVSQFQLGDSVYISTLGRTGIVCELENHKGEVGVMVMKKKLKINHKRLSLHISQAELYPEDYDLGQVFDSKEDRKKKRILEKRFQRGVVIEEKPTNP